MSSFMWLSGRQTPDFHTIVISAGATKRRLTDCLSKSSFWARALGMIRLGLVASTAPNSRQCRGQ